MSTSPRSDHQPEGPTPPDRPPERQRPFPWFWLGTVVGSVFSAAGLGLAAWGWGFIQDDLAPLISQVLTDYLERPVELGDVERVTFGSIQVGPSTVGASDEDPTTLTADTVTVDFDLLDTIFTQELGLNLTVTGAEGTLVQDEERGWLNVAVPEQEEEKTERRFKINLNEVELENSQLTLVPLPVPDQSPVPIPLNNVNGQLDLDKVTVAEKETRRVRFEVEGQPIAGGKITYKGEVNPVKADSAETDINADKKIKFATQFFIQADAAPLADILNFTLSTLNLQTDAVSFDSGKVSGNMEMALRPGETIDYSGNLSVVEATVRTDLLPLPVEEIAGETRFQGNEWTVDRAVGEYGEIAAIAEGLIDFDNGYSLSATTENVTVEDFSNTVDLDLPVPTTGNFDAIARVTGPIDSPEFSGTATATEPVIVDQLTFTSASTDFLLQGNQLFLGDIAATPSTGGALRGTGQVLLAAGSPFSFQLTGRSLPATEIARLYGLEPGFQIGLVSADATVVGRGGAVTTTVDWDAPNALYPGSGTIDINGTNLAFRDTVFTLGGGTISGTGSLINGLWDSDVSFQNVQLSAFSEDLRGDVNGQFRFSGSTADTRIGAIAAQGNVTFSDGVAAFNQQFDSFNQPLTAQVAWNGEQIQVIQASSDRITASGTLTPSFDRGFTGLERLDLDITARDYALAELPFDIPSFIDLSGRGDVTGTLAGAPTAPSFTGNLSVSDLIVNNLPFNPLLTGTVAYSPTEGVALGLTGNTDKIALNIGSTADLPQETIPNLNFDIGWRGAVARGRTQGNLLTAEAQNFPLAALNFPANGFADIGQLRGTLTATDIVANLSDQTLEGDIAIDQLGVGYIQAGRLAGKVRFADSLATLTSGELTLNENLYTVTGRLDLNGPVPVYSASADTQSGNVQNLLTALSIYRLEDFRRGLTPPDWLEDPLSPEVLEQLLATVPTGQESLDEQLNRLAEIQELEAAEAIAEAAAPIPPLRDLEGPFAGNIQIDGSGEDFQLDFDLAGNNWAWGNKYSAEDVVARGSLTPNVLTFEPVRFASTVPVPINQSPSPDAEGGNQTTPQTPFPVVTAVQPAEAYINLAGQLVFGRDTQLTSDLQATVSNIDVIDLRNILQLPLDIDGLANARATLGGTLANPQLRGSGELTNATINNTPIQTAQAGFLYQNARLALLSTLTANTPEQPLTLTANIPYAFDFMEVAPDSDAIEVKVNVQNEGLALLNIFNDQVAWESGEGQINLLVSGTRDNPLISGDASLTNAVLSAQVLPEPLTNVNGSATFTGDQIVVDSLQGQFSDGQLTAVGTFPLIAPIITGNQIVALRAEPTLPTPEAALPEAVPPEGDSAQAPPANPLFPQPLAANRPLTVNLENIDLALDTLYSGGVDGQIIVGGSALGNGPQIGGQVVLSQGQVLLPDNTGSTTGAEDSSQASAPVAIDGSFTNTTETAPVNTDPIETDRIGQLSEQNPQNGASQNGIIPIFRDLELTLGDSVRIVQGTLLNFVADGSLLLNGPPTDLEPNGVIRLRSGRVNLFTTLFRLRGRNNTASFTPEMGLQNPFLDVSLRASVPEVDSSGLLTATPFARSEIVDTSNIGFDNPGSLRTIRVRANVQGPANAIFENLELSSSPPRSQAELVGLIGGGFVTALESTVGSLSGGGDSFEGLINLVSGALLNNVQDLIGSTLSLSEFRLFPVTAASRALTEEDNETGLDIAAEVGFDVTEDASATVLKILTDDTNPEFGLNYRLTDSLTVRANTNLSDINQVLLEYEIRF
ncbi:MAG: translocation/assembly module TamB domain-containing protein [Cyanobacteria bacterium J06631_12]